MAFGSAMAEVQVSVTPYKTEIRPRSGTALTDSECEKCGERNEWGSWLTGTGHFWCRRCKRMMKHIFTPRCREFQNRKCAPTSPTKTLAALVALVTVYGVIQAVNLSCNLSMMNDNPELWCIGLFVSALCLAVTIALSWWMVRRSK